MKKSGFTLIELMVVIVVICILAAATFKIMGNMEENDKIARTKATMEKVALALEAYKAIYGKYPPVHNYDEDTGEDKPVAQPCWFEFPVYDYENYPSWDATSANSVTQGDNENPVSWEKSHLFTFGLCAFFVPRYKVARANGCFKGWLGLTDDGTGHVKEKTWGEAEKNHIFGQWHQHNRRRADSGIGDSGRDMAAARKILPYLDGSISADGRVDLGSIFHVTGEGGKTERFATPRKVTTKGHNYAIPVCSISIWDNFDDNNTVYEDEIKNHRALRYVSRPPYEAYELRSSGADRKFNTRDDIVIGSK